jgi:hypothetical protein
VVGIITATLPAEPTLGDQIEFIDVSGKWNITPLYVKSGGNTFIEGVSGDAIKCNVKYGNFKLNYIDPSNTGWKITSFPKIETNVLDGLYDGLIAFWNLNETTVGTRFDSSGNNINLRDVFGTVNSSSSIISPFIAADFSGGPIINKTLSSQRVLPVGNNTPFTLSFWINYPTFSNPGTRIITFNPLGQPTTEWGMVQGTSQFLAFNNFGVPSAAINVTNVSQLITQGVWNHVVITKDSNYVWQYYKNNILQVTVFSNPSTWFSQTNAAIYLGRNIYGSITEGPPSGSLDAVGIWNRILTPIEIAQLYNYDDVSVKGLEL